MTTSSTQSPEPLADPTAVTANSAPTGELTVTAPMGLGRV